MLPLAALTYLQPLPLCPGLLFFPLKGLKYIYFFPLYELSGVHFKGLLILMEFTCFGTSLWWGLILRCFLYFMVYRSHSLICFLCKLAVARFSPVSACSYTSSEVWGCSEPHHCQRWQESKACFKRSRAKFPKMCEFWKPCKSASCLSVLCQ